MIRLTKKPLTKAMAWLLSALMSLAIAAAPQYAVFAANEAQTASLTRAEARDTILAAASNYRDGLKPTDIMLGYPDGSLKEARAATRLEALVMISRAFGSIPAPGNDWLRSTTDELRLTAPKWAIGALLNLQGGGLLAPGADESLTDGETITAAELDTLLHRVYALYGTRAEDDFYAAVNKEWLDGSETAGIMGTNSTFGEIGALVDAQVDEILNTILRGEWAKGTPERKIADFYNAFTDKAAQEKTGAAPLRPYLESLSAAKTLKDLEKAQAELAAGLAFYPFVEYTLRADIKNSERNAVYLQMEYMSNDDYDVPATTAYVTRLFELAGVKKPAESAAEAVRIEKALCEATDGIPLKFMLPLEQQYAWYTAAQLQALLPQADMKALLAMSGLSEEPYYILMFNVEHMLGALGRLYTEDNAAALAAYAQYQLLGRNAGFMGKDFLNAHNPDGEPITPDPEYIAWMARNTMKTIFGGYIGEIYAKRYFSAEAKSDVTDMIYTFIDNYKGRIQNLTWMSEATKAMALKKLDTMTVKVGYPDKPDSFMDGLEIVGVGEGGSYIEALAAADKRKIQIDAEAQGKPIDKSAWVAPAFEVNAFYNSMANEILFPAGILQAPVYDVGAKPEENLAGIGWVIAHEITHAFDLNGSQFDEKGNLANWWADEDKAAFNALNDAVAAHYDGAELAPGLRVDGRRTLGENTADLGGVSCALEALKKDAGNPDYKLFFTQAAKMWRFTADRFQLEMLVLGDPHSNGRVRVNKLLQTFDEFYDAFGIKPGDGMYIAPENRVKIW